MQFSLDLIPTQLRSFALVAIFSLLIGLSQRKMQKKLETEKTTFGTDRTFTFIGILGYLLYILEPKSFSLFIGGGMALIIFLALNYYGRVMKHDTYGLTTILIGLITYCLAPIIMTQPSWFYIMVVVVVLMLTEMKSKFKRFVNEMRNDEIITAAKFLAISGIILPILPHNNLVEGINLTPYSVWLATVIVSAISYISYLIKRFIFPQSGLLVSAILGGLYSSTATITILARELKNAPAEHTNQYIASMVLAKGMMYLKFMVLIFIFSITVFKSIYLYLIALTLVSSLVSWYVHRLEISKNNSNKVEIDTQEEYSNPLEFKVALIFATLFVVFTVLTTYTVRYLGSSGLSILSILSGFSDITPFILNLLQNIEEIQLKSVTMGIMTAMASNTIIGMFYAYFFSGSKKEGRTILFSSFSTVIAINLILLGVVYLTL